MVPYLGAVGGGGGLEVTEILINAKDTPPDSHVHTILPTISEGLTNSLELIQRGWLKNSWQRELDEKLSLSKA